MQVDLTIQYTPNWPPPLPVWALTSPQAARLLEEVISISPDTWRQWFEQWLTLLNLDISPIQAYTLTLRLTDDADIQVLNATYRQQDRPTDVLAFAALETQSPPTVSWTVLPVELGDIVISVQTALAHVQSGSHRLLPELVWLASHGLLHLLGWDHPDPASLEQMLAQQSRLLAAVGISPPEADL